MAWKTGRNNPALGLPQVQSLAAAIDVAAQVPVGTIALYEDETQGPAEFIYLPGVASTVAGDIVLYDLNPAAPATARATVALGANSGRDVAVAIAPVVAGNYGWYQISGVAIVNIAGAGIVGPLYGTATAGNGSSGTTAGSQISGARISVAVGTPAAGQSYVTLNRPRFQTQIT